MAIQDSQCATGNKGCCLKDRPCFGPYICYDNLSVECKNSTVEAFQCCPESAPYCLFDPGNGYGCFVSKDLPTYTTPIVEVPTTVVKAPTSEPEGNAPTTAAGSVTETSNSANSEATSSPSGTSPTGSGTPLTSAGSTNLASSSGLGSPSSGSGGPSVPYGSKMASTTTRRNTTTLGPSSTDGASGGGAVATAGIGYGFFKQVGIAGLALLVIA
ncbi:hypothetical protein DFH27DRAFT_566441 [Peziza echinospora]|nr:hypothetical protein DFH27DRAFT_566441 [Peziza echinospora]